MRRPRRCNASPNLPYILEIGSALNEFLHLRCRPQRRVDLIHALRQLAHACLHHIHAAIRCIQLPCQQIELPRQSRPPLRQQGEFRCDAFKLCAACIAPVQPRHRRPRGKESQFHGAAPFAARPPVGGQK